MAADQFLLLAEPYIASVLSFIYTMMDFSSLCFSEFKSFLMTCVMTQYPHGKLVNSMSFALVTAVRIRNTQPERFHWLHSFALILFNGFGGGIATPVLMGKPCAIIVNDMLMFSAFVAFFLTHVIDLRPIFNWKPVSLVLHWFTSCFRANTIANTLVTANSFLMPTPYYPTPICGPLFLGTLSSSFGIFFPTDLGLKPISNGVPWGFQAAFISSAFFHLLVYDKEGFLGQTMRYLFGNFTDNQARLAIAILYVVHYWLQIYFEREVNLFSPIHKLLYIIIPVQGPRLTGIPNAALGPDTSKPIDTKVSVGGWTFQSLEKVEDFVELIRGAVVVLAAAIFFQVHRAEYFKA